MGTVSFLGVKRPERGVDHPSPYSAEVKESVELALKFPRQPDDGQHRPKHVVVSITVIKYTSVIKLCLTTYLLLASPSYTFTPPLGLHGLF